jgi:hypothetical protein
MVANTPSECMVGCMVRELKQLLLSAGGILWLGCVYVNYVSKSAVTWIDMFT